MKDQVAFFKSGLSDREFVAWLQDRPACRYTFLECTNPKCIDHAGAEDDPFDIEYGKDNTGI